MPLSAAYIKFTATGKALLLCLLLAATPAVAICKGSKHAKTPISKTISQQMTVVRIRPGQPADSFVRISFDHAQRIYRLPRKTKPAYLLLLQQSLDRQEQVIIKTKDHAADIIMSVQAAGSTK